MKYNTLQILFLVTFGAITFSSCNIGGCSVDDWVGTYQFEIKFALCDTSHISVFPDQLSIGKGRQFNEGIAFKTFETDVSGGACEAKILLFNFELDGDELIYQEANGCKALYRKLK